MMSSDESSGGNDPLIYHTLYEIATNTRVFDGRCNQIRDFQGSENLIVAEEIYLDNNPIESFRGATNLPNLKRISLKQTPISKLPHVGLMCLVVFGSQIEFINDLEVTEEMRDQSNTIRESILPELRNGSIISSVDPLTLNSSKDVSLEDTNAEGVSEDSDCSFQGRPLRKVVISRNRKFASDDVSDPDEESSSHNISASISSYTTDTNESTEYEEETEETEKSYVTEYTNTSTSTSINSDFE